MKNLPKFRPKYHGVDEVCIYTIKGKLYFTDKVKKNQSGVGGAKGYHGSRNWWRKKHKEFLEGEKNMLNLEETCVIKPVVVGKREKRKEKIRETMRLFELSKLPKLPPLPVL